MKNISPELVLEKIDSVLNKRQKIRTPIYNKVSENNIKIGIEQNGTDENPIIKNNHINNSDQRAEYPDGFLLFFVFHKSVDKYTENPNNNLLISL